MPEHITVNTIIIDEHRIEINYDFTEGLSPYFDPAQRTFWLQYTEDVSGVPASIAVIPFVCNVLPLVWITDSVLRLPELDETFSDCINEFKQGYIDMYPMLAFKGKIETGRIIRNDYVRDGGNAAFFSGGVDAFTTLVSHLSERPTLITLRGSDIKLDDVEGWGNVYRHLQSTVKEFDLPEPVCITSNFRTFIQEGVLSRLVRDSKDGWWHGFQCGIGLFSQAAPLAWVKHFDVIYIASSFTLNDIVTSATYPTIDNHVRFGNSKIKHDQFEHCRQEKIQILVKHHKESGKTLNLRVCWITRGGKNCCQCEKCLRTIFGLLAEGEDPQKYGFDYTEKDIQNSQIIVKDSLYKRQGVTHWPYIIKRFKETGYYMHDKRINWVYHLNPYAQPPKPSIFKRIKERGYWTIYAFIQKLFFIHTKK